MEVKMQQSEKLNLQNEPSNEHSRIRGNGPKIGEARAMRRAADMLRWASGGLLGACLICLVAIAVVGLFRGYQGKGGGSDIAAWIQAVGSITAILWAAWIASFDRWSERQVRRAEGVELAWSARFLMVQMQFEAQIVAAELGDGTNYGNREIRG